MVQVHPHPPVFKRVSPSGKVSAFQADIRGFESRRPLHFKNLIRGEQVSKKRKRKNSEPKESPYERLGLVDINDVLAVKNKETNEFQGEVIKLTSLRMQTFLNKGTICSACKRKARYFAIERHRSRQEGHSNSYHLNLYGVDSEGNELLFTHDHTIARSLGGKDHLSNTTTMCSYCNNVKSMCENKISLLNQWYKQHGYDFRVALVQDFSDEIMKEIDKVSQEVEILLNQDSDILLEELGIE